jgi:N-ethylmaleimide reductase
MAPLTRLRSLEPGDVPTAMMAEYYGQRASAGLIISEATQISFQAKGYSGSPGIHRRADRRLAPGQRRHPPTRRAQRGAGVAHRARVAHLVATGWRSAGGAFGLPANARTTLRDENGQLTRVDTSTPRLERSRDRRHRRRLRPGGGQRPRSRLRFHRAACGPRLPAAPVPDPSANTRDDRYGGSVENRARIVLEAVDAAIAQWSAERVGIRIFPLGGFNGIDNGEDQEAAGLYLIGELAKRNLAYLHLSEPDWAGGKPLRDEFREAIRAAYPGVIVAAGAYTADKAEDLLARDRCGGLWPGVHCQPGFGRTAAAAGAAERASGAVRLCQRG